jgi:hypothetical protein
MAKLAVFSISGKTFKAGINKIDRDKIYGYVKEQSYDINGDECSLGSVLNDGSTFVLSGATAMKKVDEQNREIDKSEIKTINLEGKDAELVPSIFDIENELKEVPLDKVLDLQVELAYQLSFESDADKELALSKLKTDAAYYFLYNYRADYEGSDAYIISNAKEIFLLSGKLIKFEFLDNKTIIAIEETEDDSSEEDDLDFGML